MTFVIPKSPFFALFVLKNWCLVQFFYILLHLNTIAFLCTNFWPLKNWVIFIKKWINDFFIAKCRIVILNIDMSDMSNGQMCHILPYFAIFCKKKSYYTGEFILLVRFWIRTIPGIVLSEIVPSGDPLYKLSYCGSVSLVF